MFNNLVGEICKNVESNAELAKKIMFLTSMTIIIQNKVGSRNQTFSLQFLKFWKDLQMLKHLVTNFFIYRKRHWAVKVCTETYFFCC